jgi:hypothetical protein
MEAPPLGCAAPAMEHRITFHFTPKHASWLNQIDNHLVGAYEQSGCEREAKCFGGLQIENCFVFGRRLNR